MAAIVRLHLPVLHSPRPSACFARLLKPRCRGVVRLRRPPSFAPECSSLVLCRWVVWWGQLVRLEGCLTWTAKKVAWRIREASPTGMSRSQRSQHSYAACRCQNPRVVRFAHGSYDPGRSFVGGTPRPRRASWSLLRSPLASSQRHSKQQASSS